MEVLYHGIKTRYAYDFPLCFPHELIMSLRREDPVEKNCRAGKGLDCNGGVSGRSSIIKIN